MARFIMQHQQADDPLFIEWTGTRDNDEISYLDSDVPVHARGRGGNDGINGSNGNDVLEGGKGNDGIVGSDGNDFLRGGAGDDVLIGAAGFDVMVGGPGNDKIFFTGGDLSRGGLGDDVFFTTTNAAAGFAYIDFNLGDTLEIDSARRSDISVQGGVLMVKEFDGYLMIGGVDLIIADVGDAIAKGMLVLDHPQDAPMMMDHFHGILA